MLVSLVRGRLNGVRWMKLSGDLKIDALHIDFLKKVAKNHNAHW